MSREIIDECARHGPAMVEEDRLRLQEDDGDAEWDADVTIMEPYVRDTPKAGRNDPCPCGSGKKYKKCCLQGALPDVP